MESLLNMLQLPTVDNKENKALITQITEEEINYVIGRLKGNKAPGADGFTAEWYKKLRELLTHVLLRIFNWILAGGEVSPLMETNNYWMYITPKEGKDKLECSNYRPISILNLDYKIFTLIISRRLEKNLRKIINLDQTGLIKSRQTHDSIRRSLQIIRHITLNKLQAILVSLDAEKACEWDGNSCSE